MMPFTTELDIKYDIKLSIMIKSDIKYVFSHNYVEIKICSYDFLLLKNTFSFHNVIILIQSAFNKNKNHYYYNIVLGKYSYQLPKK